MQLSPTAAASKGVTVSTVSKSETEPQSVTKKQDMSCVVKPRWHGMTHKQQSSMAANEAPENSHTVGVYGLCHTAAAAAKLY
jgi:hypothetical protein